MISNSRTESDVLQDTTCRLFQQIILRALVLVALILAVNDAVWADQAKKPLSVLLITVDNMRPANMSVYDYDKDTTPNLARFAEESAVFDHAFSVSAWTSPGMVSIFTGYYPPVHAQSGRYTYYDKEMTSALRVLAAEGYEILGQSISGPSHEDFGFERMLGRRPDQLENFIESRVSNDQHFFAWAHLRDVHLPYTPTQRNAEKFGITSHTSEGIEAVLNHKMIFRPDGVDVNYVHADRVNFTEDDVPVIRALYDGELADVDERLDRAFQRMREIGLLEHTIVVISADHGEELFEHGWVGHASTSYDGKLYDELIRIPLIIRFPDGSLTGRFDALAQSVDLMPTIFELLGVSDAGMVPPMQGSSLLPIIRGEREKVRDYVFTQTTMKGWTTPKEELSRRVVSVRSRTHKLIWFPDAGGTRVEGYDLRQDPAETNNIYPERAEEFADLEQALEKWWEDNRTTAADLVLGGAGRQIMNIARAALGEDGLSDAVEGWMAIEDMDQTWGPEVNRSYAREPYAARWQEIRRNAAEMIAKAMTCDVQGGTLQSSHPTQPNDVESWSCSP